MFRSDRRSRWLPEALLGVALLLGTACGGGSKSPTQTEPPTSGAVSPTSAQAGTPQASATQSASGATPTRTGATAPTATASHATATSAPPTASGTQAGAGSSATATATEGAVEVPDYLDDRSSADVLIESYYNAINRHEYERAYAYWEPGVPATQLPAFDQFQQGYATTAKVDITLGAIGSGVGAGQLYYSVPVALDASMTDGSSAFYVGCYVLHLGNPAIQTEPPFQPLAIQSATVDEAASAADAQSQLADACAAQGSSATVAPSTPTTAPANIDASVYVDNRSTPETVLDSLYNAVNRQEYARVFSYWAGDAADLAPFDQFRQGYADTKSVTLTFGATQADPGAGQLNYSQPVAVVATQSDGSTQTFVGCYRLHLTQPALQAQPPFQSLAIEGGSLQQVDNGSDLASQLATSCQP